MSDILDEFLKTVCSSDQEKRLEYIKSIDDYLTNPNNNQDTNLNTYQLLKFCEATLLFLKSEKAKEDIDGLITIQLFIQSATDAIKTYLTES